MSASARSGPCRPRAKTAANAHAARARMDRSGSARERWYADRAPHALHAELLAMPDVELSRLGMFEFDTPAVDFYAGAGGGGGGGVESINDVVPRHGVVGAGPRTLADIRRQLERDGGTYTLLIRRTQPADMDPQPAIERLAAAGLHTEPIALTSRFIIDNQRTEIDAVRVSLPPSSPLPAEAPG